MFTSVFVYSTLFITLLFLSIIAARNQQYSLSHYGKSKLSWPLFVSLVLFAIVFGIRDNVGIDYPQYLSLYENPSELDQYELCFRFLSKAMAALGLPAWFYFGTWAFLQLLFVFLAFRDEPKLYPFLIMVLFCGQYFLLWMNVIRQDLATCILIFSVGFIPQKKLKQFIILVLIASGFHITAIALLLLYPIFRHKMDYTRNPAIQEIILLCALFICFMGNVFGDIDSLIAPYLIGTSFEEYAYGAIEHTTKESVFGVTFWMSFIIDIVMIAYSNKLKRFYKSDTFLIYYNLYFFGAIFNLMFAFSYLLLRPFRYFRFFKLVVVPFLLFYLWKNRKFSKFRETLCLALILLAYLALYIAVFRYGSSSMYQYHSLVLGI